MSLLPGSGFILDGFPRTLVQADVLKRHWEDEGLTLNALINYELTLSEIVMRLSGRRTCRQCKAVFHVTAQPPGTAGVCDHCGSALYQREDDRPASITIRMEAYKRSTLPLIQFYLGLGLLLTRGRHRNTRPDLRTRDERLGGLRVKIEMGLRPVARTSTFLVDSTRSFAPRPLFGALYIVW
jgi:adenylate kinase family enzyme